MAQLPMQVVGLRVIGDPPLSVLVLGTEDRARYLTMEIGPLETNAVAMAIERMPTPRPMTHDLLWKLVGEMGGEVRGVSIVDVRDQTFFAEITVETPSGPRVLDARPSDAIALALRAGAPITCDERVLDAAGLRPDAASPDEPQP